MVHEPSHECFTVFCAASRDFHEYVHEWPQMSNSSHRCTALHVLSMFKMQHGSRRSQARELTLDGVVQLLLLFVLQRELLPLLLNVLLQSLELLAHNAVLSLEPQACLQAHMYTHTGSNNRPAAYWQQS